MIHGVLNVFKEKGYTSHDVVAKLRGITRQKKIGHTGTLDPDAEGVLPVCFGKATRLCDMLTDKSKVYETVLLLGIETDTQDITGTVLRQAETDHLTDEEVRNCIQGYVGEYDQIPPMYSALKVNGKKLCDLAREGKTVERKSRRVHIFEIEILQMELPRVKMRVHCSKGTYIRTLCSDIGTSLGTGGCMESLLRTRVASFEVKDSLRLAEIEAKMQAGTLMDSIIPIDQMFPEYAKLHVKKIFEPLACNGNALKPEMFSEAGVSIFEDAVSEKTGCGENLSGKKDSGNHFRVYTENDVFIGIYEYQPVARSMKLRKMFYAGEEQTGK